VPHYVVSEQEAVVRKTNYREGGSGPQHGTLQMKPVFRAKTENDTQTLV